MNLPLLSFLSFLCFLPLPLPSKTQHLLLFSDDQRVDAVGVYGNYVMHLQEEETTLADYLRQAGYQTAMFGKWHLNGKFNQPEQPQPGDHGFDYWLATQNHAVPPTKTFIILEETVSKWVHWKGFPVG